MCAQAHGSRSRTLSIDMTCNTCCLWLYRVWSVQTMGKIKEIKWARERENTTPMCAWTTQSELK